MQRAQERVLGMPYTTKLRLHVLVLIAVSIGVALPLPARAATARYTAGPVLFMGTRGGNPDLYVVRSAKETEEKVISNPGHDCGPAMRPTPPGSKVREMVFASMRMEGSYDPGGHFQLYRFNFRTHKLRRLTTTPGHNFGPTWSPDGRHLGFSSTRNGSAAVGAPNWPVSAASLFVMNPDGSHVRQITDAGAFRTDNFPAWSPNGKWIAFQSTPKDDPLHPSVYVVRPNGQGMHVLQHDAMYPSWSPDGKKIAFTSARVGRPNEQDLYVMDADGSDARRLTRYAGAEFMPAWSADGKHITFVRDPDGWTDIAAVVLLPTGHTQDIFTSGPALSTIWVADLANNRGVYRITHLYQRTKGGSDLFPHFAPTWLR